MEATLRLRNYLKFHLVKILVKENAYENPKIVKISRFCTEVLQQKINFCDPTVLQLSQTCLNRSRTS